MVVTTPSWLVNFYGAEYAETPPAEGFQSRGEELIWYELKRRRIPFIYQWFPGDIPFTYAREERSADFYFPNLKLALNPTSPFTHPDPTEDALTRQLFLLLGVETIFIPERDILPELGGDVRDALDRVPGLVGFGQHSRRERSTQPTKAQPPRDLTHGRHDRAKRY